MTPDPFSYSCDQPKNPSGNIGLDSGAFLVMAGLFERVDQIVAHPIRMLIGDN